MVPFNVDLKNKVVVVTGAGGVICSELSERIAECGAKVALLDLDFSKADAVAKKIIKNGGIAKGFSCNVLSKDNLKEVHMQIIESLGRVDILVNGAGGNNPKATTDVEYHETGLDSELKTFFDLSKEGVEFVFNLNFLGTFLPCQEFCQDMVNKKGACVLNISSMNAFTPLTKIPAYSAAKASVSNFTKWLAVHFSHVGIRVNAIAPGFFLTSQNASLLLDKNGKPTKRCEKIINATPMGKLGDVKDLVGATLFLLSEDASGFISGVVLPIDGGFSSYSGV